MKPKLLLAVLAFGVWFGATPLFAQDAGKKPPANKKQQPKAVKVSSQLAVSDPLDYLTGSSYFKVHKVKLYKGFNYSLSVTAPFPPYIRVEDFRGNQRAVTTQYVNNAVTMEFTPGETETYRVIIASRSGRRTGNYTLSVRPKAVELMVKDQLTVKDAIDATKPGHYCKIHKLKMAPGNTYTIHCTTTINDGWLRLEDSTKRQLAWNDDWMNTRNSRIVFTPTKADTYRIIVTTYSQGTTGPYTLTVSK